MSLTSRSHTPFMGPQLTERLNSTQNNFYIKNSFIDSLMLKKGKKKAHYNKYNSVNYMNEKKRTLRKYAGSPRKLFNSTILSLMNKSETKVTTKRVDIPDSEGELKLEFSHRKLPS